MSITALTILWLTLEVRWAQIHLVDSYRVYPSRVMECVYPSRLNRPSPRKKMGRSLYHLHERILERVTRGMTSYSKGFWDLPQMQG